MKIILYIFLIAAMTCQSQSYLYSYIHLDTIIEFNESRVSNRINPFFLMNASNNKHLIFSDFNYNSPYVCTNENIDSEGLTQIQFTVIDLRNCTMKKINIPNTNNLKFVHGFSMNERYFLLADNSNIFIYEKTIVDEYVYKSKIKIPVAPRQFLYIDNNNAVFFGEIGFKGKEFQNGIYKTALDEKKPISNYSPDFSTPEFSYISPKMWYNMTDNCIFTSQTIRYEIDVLNKNMKKVYSIKRTDLKWESADENMLKKAEEIRKKNFEDGKWRQIIIELDSTTSRIHGIFPVNDSSLIVYYSIPDIKLSHVNMYLDVWKLSNDKWNLHKKDILIENRKVIQENWLFTKEKYYPMLGISNSFLFTTENLIVFSFNVPFDMTNKTWKDFLDYLENNPNEKTLMVYIYSHHLFD